MSIEEGGGGFYVLNGAGHRVAWRPTRTQAEAVIAFWTQHNAASEGAFRVAADRLAIHEARANYAETGGTLIMYRDYKVLVEVAKAAEDWLENDHLPGGGRMRRKERLRSALARLGSGAAEGDA